MGIIIIISGGGSSSNSSSISLREKGNKCHFLVIKNIINMGAENMRLENARTDWLWTADQV